jgi:hypothetical protein
MRWLVNFGRFWYDFIVGDDWTIALGVTAAVALTAVVANANLTAWPILPLTVIVGLAWSVARARRSQSRTAETTDVVDG